MGKFYSLLTSVGIYEQNLSLPSYEMDLKLMENALIEVKNGKHFAYRFRTNTNDGLLKESHIGLSGTRYGINWRYDKFRPLEQRQFPGTMTVSFEGAAKPVTAVFELSRLSTNKDWEAHTEVPGKYERIELQDLLKQLIK